MSERQRGWLIYGLLLVAALSFRVAVARFLPNDDPGDGKIYAQFARNLLEHHVYSHATEPPYGPSLIRLPGYPLFLAAVYAVFGHGDNSAVRIIQALIDTATCAMVALVAFYWEPDPKRKRASSIAALALASICPFPTIYVATILTETPSACLAIGMCLTATLAFRSYTTERSLALWAVTGLIAGLAVLCRPDSGLFAAALGMTLVVSTMSRRGQEGERNGQPLNKAGRFMKTVYLGGAFSLAFCLALSPWTIRNWRVFHLFQPLAPTHAEMPGEFVPHGYLAWLRTWLDEERYIGPLLWSLDELPIKLADIPDRAFDSPQEKLRVATLLEKYNHREEPLVHPPPDSTTQGPVVDEKRTLPTPEPGISPAKQEPAPSHEEMKPDQGDEADNEGEDEEEESESAEENSVPEHQPVEMTPDIDAGFATIARERIARAPLRYYLWLPAKRATSLWFNTHSQYYPFEGELFPLEDLDHDLHQQFWLPLFAGLTWVYTVLGVAGGWYLWSSGNFAARRWLLLAALMIFLRIGFFSTVENPEPRYVVEIFPFLSILGGLAAAQMTDFSKLRNLSKL